MGFKEVGMKNDKETNLRAITIDTTGFQTYTHDGDEYIISFDVAREEGEKRLIDKIKENLNGYFKPSKK